MKAINKAIIPDIIQPKILIDPYSESDAGNIKIPTPIIFPITRLID